METSLTRTIVWRNRAAVSLIPQSIADIDHTSSDSISKLHQGTCTTAFNHGIAIPHSYGTSHLIPLNTQRGPPKIDKRRYDILPHNKNVVEPISAFHKKNTELTDPPSGDVNCPQQMETTSSNPSPSVGTSECKSTPESVLPPSASLPNRGDTLLGPWCALLQLPNDGVDFGGPSMAGSPITSDWFSCFSITVGPEHPQPTFSFSSFAFSSRTLTNNNSIFSG